MTSGETIRDERVGASFHQVWKIIPSDGEVVTTNLDSGILKALAAMVEHHFSQLPVRGPKGEVVGLFSFRSLARELLNNPSARLAEMTVDDVMESPVFVPPDASLHTILDDLNRQEALLVGSKRSLKAIATAEDVLKYFYNVARPFVLIQEIELALRSIIVTVGKDDVIPLINESLTSSYTARGMNVPLSLDEVSFDDYIALITSKRNWERFSPILGRNRQSTLSKLESIRKIRNRVVHFRGEVTVVDHETLFAVRDWLLRKVTTLEEMEGSTE